MEETKEKAIDVPYLIEFNKAIENLFNNVKQFYSEDVLTPNERRRMFGAGVRNYGFIDKTSDIALANSKFAPRTFDTDKFKSILRQLEEERTAVLLLQQLLRLLSDRLLLTSDEAYRNALLYYNSLKELAKARVPGAEEVFNALRPFFRRPKRTGGEPTEHELKRDFNALLHGTKDGKIVIENEKPVVIEGKHKVIDEIKN